MAKKVNNNIPKDNNIIPVLLEEALSFATSTA